MAICDIYRDLAIKIYACAYEFLTVVTQGVVHGVHKIVIRSAFGVIQQHKVS